MGSGHVPDNKKISVIIPVYNGKKYLAKAISSVAQQTHPAHELIVVDDGSTDDSALLVAELAKEYPINFFQKENGGQSSARNYGVRVSTGELLAFLDQDDVWYPNHLAETVKPFLRTNYPELGWVYTTVDEIGGNDQLFTIDILSHIPSPHPKKSILDCLSADMFVVPSATLVSRKAFDAVGGFDEKLSGYEDDDLFIRIFSKGYGNYFINKSTAQWRIHGGSSSRTIKMAQSRMIYAHKLLNIYKNDIMLGKSYRDIILSRFVFIIIHEYDKAKIFGDKSYAKLMRDDLHKLYPYMEIPLKLKCKLLLFVYNHQLLKSFLAPFARFFGIS